MGTILVLLFILGIVWVMLTLVLWATPHYGGLVSSLICTYDDSTVVGVREGHIDGGMSIIYYCLDPAGNLENLSWLDIAFSTLPLAAVVAILFLIGNRQAKRQAAAEAVNN
ncbi:MAG: hypothetical protein Q4G35_09565 [Propionibacteriaceae bacterium]|nr:hypothetical protein [Propionibacteriaceae bacterium]